MELPFFIYAGVHEESFVPFHKHDDAEIVQVTQGRCSITAGGKNFLLEKDDILVIPAGCLHNQKDEPGEENVYFIFLADAAFFPQELQFIQGVGSLFTERLVSELSQMVIEQNTSGAGALVQAILERYLRQMEPVHTHSPQLNKALNVIHRKYHWNCSIGELAAECGVSPGYFRQIFHNELGISPLEYRANMRLKLSYSLLRDPQLSIKEIAEKCGMPDVNYFIRFFHQRTGTTPAVFRRNTKES